MTQDQRRLLFGLVQTCGIESVATELSSICSWQEIRSSSERKKLWRKAELAFDRVAQNLPLQLRELRHSMVPDHD